MSIEYRLYNNIGKKYFTARDSERVYLAPNGRVMCYSEAMGLYDISKTVKVEQWTGAFDNQSIPPKKIFDGDKIRVGGPDFDSSFNEELGEYIDVEEYYVEWRGDEQYPAFDLRPASGHQFPCDSNRIAYLLTEIGCRIKVIGTIHDESEASNAI
jgi:hypothetical protein